MTTSWTTEIDWHLTNRCNFFCTYCFPQIRAVLNRKSLDEPEPAAIARAFEQFAGPCLIHMSGGEPFLFPGFVELVERLAEQHYISINTNLSTTELVGDFVAAVPPKRVSEIVAAVHVVERERLGLSLADYASNFLNLERSGFPVKPLYVMHPAQFDRVESDLRTLAGLGVRKTQVKVFKGVFGGKEYPESYSEQERETLASIGTEYDFTDAYLAGIRQSFKGLACTAGTSSFKVDVRGEVRRCATVPTSYGNLFDGSFQPDTAPRPCSASKVKVVSQCLRYSCAGTRAH